MKSTIKELEMPRTLLILSTFLLAAVMAPVAAADDDLPIWLNYSCTSMGVYDGDQFTFDEDLRNSYDVHNALDWNDGFLIDQDKGADAYLEYGGPSGTGYKFSVYGRLGDVCDILGQIPPLPDP